jgi:hydrogenase/urease accessory protein HupE
MRLVRVFRPALQGCTTAALIAVAAPAAAHPVPFSSLDLQLHADAIEGTFVAHVIGLAYDLRIVDAGRLLNPSTLPEHQPRIAALLASRIRIEADGASLIGVWTDAQPLPERRSVRMRVRVALRARPGRISIGATAFPDDPQHQTFLNIHEGGALAMQAVITPDRPSVDYYTNTRQGTLAVVRTFVPTGIHHIAIGPDHLLFLLGLLLFGGTLWQLVRIVTAFTIGHSITLALAALDVVSISSDIVEPAIAMSVVYVGVDNLVAQESGRDVRGWIALAFGLIHGFGFASVLKEVGLPGTALGWSLFSFNLGVEVGQLVVVVIVTTALAAVRQRSARLARQIALAGSGIVIVAGAYWFIERVFLAGGI